MAYTNFTGPVQADFGFQTASYTVADLPAVEDNIFLIASDANGGTGTVVFGKSGQWIDARTDLPVSTNPPTPVPYVGLVAPDVGSIAGGENITITGFNFTGVTAVSIGGTPVTSFALVDDATITAVTAPRAAGNVYVNVTNAYGTSSNTPGATYIYQVPVVNPVITSTSVPGGWVGGGSSNFVINGTGFTGTSAVTFNGNSASFVELSDTSILITNFPGGVTGSAFIIVTTSAGGASIPYMSWDYITNGVITSISPNSGVSTGGTNITVSGYGFNTTNQLQFEIPGAGLASATGLSVVSDNELTAVTPNIVFTGSANARVANPSYGFGSYANGVFTFTSAVTTPVINNVNVLGAFAYGASITEVIIDLSGTYAASITGVTVQGMAVGFSVYSSTQIVITSIPSGSVGNAPIIVTNAAGSSSPWTNFELVPAPVITQVVPSSASNAGGTSMSMYGYGFTNANHIQFLPGGGSPSSATPTVYVDSYLTVTLPPNGGTGATDVRGSNTLTLIGPWASGLFTYTAAPILPVIFSTDYPGGSVFGGTCDFNINGSHFTGTTSVTFNGNAASYSITSDATLRILNIPSGAVGTATIIVTNGSGPSAPYTGWTYYDTPRITYVAPSNGTSAGGTSITVFGYALQQMTECLFIGATDTQNRPGISSTNDNFVVFTTPAHVAEITQLRGWNNTYGPGPVSSPLYTFTSAGPTISGTNINGGSVVGGATSLGLFGSGFNGATSVTFQGNPSTYSVISDTYILISNIPAGTAGSGDIVVTTPSGSSSPWTSWNYVTAPVIAACAPNNGSTSGGTSVTAQGYGFNNSTPGSDSMRLYNSSFSYPIIDTRANDLECTFTTLAYPTGEPVRVAAQSTTSGGFGPDSSLGVFTYVGPFTTPFSYSQGPDYGAGGLYYEETGPGVFELRAGTYSFNNPTAFFNLIQMPSSFTGTLMPNNTGVTVSYTTTSTWVDNGSYWSCGVIMGGSPGGTVNIGIISG